MGLLFYLWHITVKTMENIHFVCYFKKKYISQTFLIVKIDTYVKLNTFNYL
jgi:hypothetical protein